MYRVVAILGGALTLAACSSAEFGNLDAFKPAPVMDTVSFETEPAGAYVKVSNGQTCKTPCALALPTDQPLNVTFSLAGYDSAAETLAPVVPKKAGVEELFVGSEKLNRFYESSQKIFEDKFRQ